MTFAFVSVVALMPATDPSIGLEEYVIREVRRESAFAGKLGRRVHEQLVLNQGGRTIVVDVKGDYHTMCVRPGARLSAGDRVSLRSSLTDGSRVSRDSIKRVARG